ncbi:MAG: hypothetical protein ABW185_07025 [Sedimenticola sp.]
MSVRGASKQYAVPLQTLRDRLIGRVDPDCTTTGRPPIFSMEEEAKISNHLKSVSQYGYGYTRSEVSLLATDYGKQLGKVETVLTRNWMDGFLRRWPELKVLRPRSLELARAKSASEPIVERYFEELSKIISKYDLQDKPQLIFNIDEKGVSPNHTPPSIIGVKGQQPPAVTTGKSQTTTIIGCGSAAGMTVPPYFVFAGKRWCDELLVGKTPGASGTLSETGWSNSQVFRDYLQNHFMKFVPEHTTHPLLVLLDGHSTHVSVGLIEWAKSKNIILFILPAHTSHILQPLDVSCYGPFQRMYNTECHKHMRISAAAITRYNVCELSCNVYTKALSSENLVAGFRKTGIFPTDKAAINKLDLIPSEIFASDTTDDSTCKSPESADQPVNDATASIVIDTPVQQLIEPQKESDQNQFFETKLQQLKTVKSGKKKTRRSVSKIVSGKPITEDNVHKLVKDYESTKKIPRKRKQPTSKQVTVKPRTTRTKKVCKRVSSPQPGPSHISVNRSVTDSSSDSDEEVAEKDKCCVCHKFTPDAVRKAVSLIFVKWVACKKCEHWVHLSYCTQVNVIRRTDSYFCPCCNEE